MLNIISWCVFGLIVGAIARFLVPGRDPMGCIGTMLLGVVGAFLGGFLGNLVTGGGWNNFEPAGFIGAVIGGIVVLLIYRRLSKNRARHRLGT